MNHGKNSISIAIIALLLYSSGLCYGKDGKKMHDANEQDSLVIALPSPDKKGSVSLEKALLKRQSARVFENETFFIKELSQLLWAAQGITRRFGDSTISRKNQKLGGFRTAPSAGALYPLELYVAVRSITDVEQGLYKYNPFNHTLQKVLSGDKSNELADAALKQRCVREAAAIIIICGVYSRTAIKYGTRGEQYVHMECGAVCQNIYLQATVLGLGTVLVGAFQNTTIHSILNLPVQESPLALMPIGRVK